MAVPKMNVHHLLRDELEYELKMRGVDATTMKVTDMRASLRSLTKLERANRSMAYADCPFDATTELPAISAKYTELSVLLDEAGTDLTGRVGHRGVSRVLHLLDRVDLIPLTSDEDATLPKQRGEWLAKVSALLTRFQRFRTSDREVNLSSTIADASAPASDDDTEDGSEDDEPAAVSRSGGPASGSRVPLYKWNVRFSGEPNTLSVMNFLERVEELRLARGYSEAELHRGSLDLFEGKALLWYRSAIRQCRTWRELAVRLKTHYLPPDYRNRLFQELLSRTQGPNEPFVEYFSCIQALIVRYGGMSKAVQLDIVRRNLAPFYLMQLPAVDTLDELETECLKLETKKFLADHYRAPPRRSDASVEPELACLSAGLSAVNVSPIRPEDDERAPRPVDDRRCYHCGLKGHLIRDCPRRRNRPSENSRRRV